VSNSKTEIKIGAIHFKAEGGERWVSGQLKKFTSFVATVPELSRLLPKSDGLEKSKPRDVSELSDEELDQIMRAGGIDPSLTYEEIMELLAKKGGEETTG